jgi:hypothetical protein
LRQDSEIHYRSKEELYLGSIWHQQEFSQVLRLRIHHVEMKEKPPYSRMTQEPATRINFKFSTLAERRQELGKG